MKNFENIVVAVDMSDYSDLVMQQGRALAHLLNKPLSCVYVVPKKEETSKSEKNKAKVVQQYCELIRKKYKLDADIQVHVQFGETEKMIIETAELYRDPLIVVGHRGRNTLNEFFLGSTAKKLAVLSQKPVWIHRGEKLIIPSRIIVPCDLGLKSIPLVEAVKKLVHAFKANFEIFHVMRMPTPTSEMAAYGVVYQAFKENDDSEVAQFAKNFPDLKVSRSEGDIAHEVKEKAKEFDLVVVAPSYRGADLPFFGTLTTHLISSGQTPILVLHGLSQHKTASLEIW